MHHTNSGNSRGSTRAQLVLVASAYRDPGSSEAAVLLRVVLGVQVLLLVLAPPHPRRPDSVIREVMVKDITSLINDVDHDRKIHDDINGWSKEMLKTLVLCCALCFVL